MPAATFERIDHTADVGLRLLAPTEADLFVTAVAGLHALWGLPAPEPPAGAPTEPLEVHGADIESLLVAWLNELIFQATAAGRVAASVQEPCLADGRFRAEVAWQPVQWDTSVDGADIKAATYHTVHVTETAEGFTTTIIFDV